jgi:hypothetical protein
MSPSSGNASMKSSFFPFDVAEVHVEDLAELAEPADHLEHLSVVVTGYFFARQSIGDRGALLRLVQPRLIALTRGPDHGLCNVGLAIP